MTDALLRDEVVVRQEIVRQGLFEFGGARKAGLLAKFADATVESLNHAVCLGMAGRAMAQERGLDRLACDLDHAQGLICGGDWSTQEE
jgi:hypothetical protein